MQHEGTSSYLMFFVDPPFDIYQTMSEEQKGQLAQEWNEWYDRLAAKGKVQHGHPLTSQHRIISGARGERIVDGPFAEAKETIGGYFLLTVADLVEATEIAQRCPSLRLGMTVQLRTIAESCPALGVRGRSQNVAETANVS